MTLAMSRADRRTVMDCTSRAAMGCSKATRCTTTAGTASTSTTTPDPTTTPRGTSFEKTGTSATEQVGNQPMPSWCRGVATTSCTTTSSTTIRAACRCTQVQATRRCTTTPSTTTL